MKNTKLLWLTLLLGLLFGACNKNRLDFDHFQGVALEGEALLPLAHSSYSVMELMERFQIDSVITTTASGNMFYHYNYEHLNGVTGEDFMFFSNASYDQYFYFSTPFPLFFQNPIDTVVQVKQTVVLESEHVFVRQATLKSGTFGFSVFSNLGAIQRVVVRSDQIRDAEGNAFQYVYTPEAGNASIDLAGFQWESAEENTLDFDFEVHLSLQGLVNNDLEFHAHTVASNIALSQMTGRVEPYVSRNVIDTVFDLFPDNVMGNLIIEDIDVHLKMRNTFGMASRLVVDTTLIWGPAMAQMSVFDPMPLVIDMEYSPNFQEVYNAYLTGVICTHGGEAYSSSSFVLNPEGLTDWVTVDDTCSLSAHLDALIPFKFLIDDVHYLDTVNMMLSELDSPEWIKKLTLELTLNSTLPFRLNGGFYMYDSERDEVTDILLQNATLLEASYDGQTKTTTVVLEVTEDRLQNVLRSDQIILDLAVDTESQDVSLNVNQTLNFFVKAKVEYDGNVEFEKE